MFMRPTQFSPQFTYNEQLGAFHKMTRGQARNEFDAWLRRRFPLVSDAARGFGPGALQGMGAEGAPAPAASTTPGWLQNILNVAPQIVSTAAQYKIIRMNVQRAEKGLPPIDTAVAAPTVRVQAEVDPGIKKALFIGGGIIAAAAVVAALR